MECCVGLAGETGVVGCTVTGQAIVGALVAVSSISAAEVVSSCAGAGVWTLGVDAV